MPYAPEYLHLVFPGVQFEAYLYGRNSVDPTKHGSSVEDQLATGRSMCQRHNWPIADEFADTGISASRHGGKTRDDFEELIAVLESGPARPGVKRIVVAFEASRYYRDLEAYLRLRNACLNGDALLCYNGQVYDLSRRDDRKTTAMHAIDAEDEVEGIRDRNLRTARETAEAGRPHGPLQYGYVREYEVVNGRLRCVAQNEHPERGRLVVESLERMDQGGTLASITRWLLETPEAKRPDGREWNERAVRRMLLNRSYLGERYHNGDWRKAAWEPLKGLQTPAGRAMFNRVTAKLEDPDRRTQRGSAPAHLLSMLALCGRCGDHALLEGLPSAKGGNPALRCKEKRDVSIREDVADAFVEEAVIGWFCDKKKATAALVPDDGDVEEKVTAAQRRINAFEEQLREARAEAEEYDEESGRFRLSAASLASMEQRLLPKLEAERKKLQAVTGISPLLLALLNAPDPDAVWNGRFGVDGADDMPALSLEQKREVIRSVVTVRLNKARVTGVHRLEPGRISLSFVGDPGFRDRPLRVPGTAHVQVAGSGTE